MYLFYSWERSRIQAPGVPFSCSIFPLQTWVRVQSTTSDISAPFYFYETMAKPKKNEYFSMSVDETDFDAKIKYGFQENL